MNEILILPTAAEGLAQPSPPQTKKAADHPSEAPVSFRERLDKARRAKASPNDEQPQPKCLEEGDKPLLDSSEEVEKPDSPCEPVTDTLAVPLEILSATVIPQSVPREGNLLQQMKNQSEAVVEVVTTVNEPTVPAPQQTTLLQTAESQAINQAAQEILTQTALAVEAEQPKAAQVDLKPFETLMRQANETTQEAATPLDGFEIKATPKAQYEPSNPFQEKKADMQPVEQRSTEAKAAQNTPASATTTAPSESLQNTVKGVEVEKTASAGKAVSQEVSKGEGKSGDSPPVQTASSAASPPSQSAAKPTEPARMAEAQRPELVQQIAREVEGLNKSNQHSIRIQLYPESLGKIELRLVSNAEGVRIVMNAEQPATSFMLERHLPELKETLAQAGVNLAGLTVGERNQQEHSASPQRNFTTSGQSWRNALLSTDDGEKESSVQNGLFDSSSQIDYRI
ncbi:MAG: flagellar hook-length control protein FliK [Chloroflexota bacterium]